MDPTEITYEMVNKKLREIALARGKKGVDRQEQVFLIPSIQKFGIFITEFLNNPSRDLTTLSRKKGKCARKSLEALLA